MGARPKSSLRPLSQAEQQTLHRVAKASSERVDTVKRAKALLEVAAGKSFTQAGRLAGLPTIGATTIGRILHEEGYRLLRDRT